MKHVGRAALGALAAAMLSACGAAPKASPTTVASNDDVRTDASGPAKAKPSNTKIVVKAVGLRNRKGSLLVLVHDAEEGFPGDAKKAIRQARVSLGSVPKDQPPAIVFSGLPRKPVAVAVFHDENDNRSLDTSFIGIPTEGIGASNDAQGMFGPPDWDDAKVRLVHPSSEIEVELVYFL